MWRRESGKVAHKECTKLATPVGTWAPLHLAGSHHGKCLRATPPGQGSWGPLCPIALSHLSVPAAWEAQQVLEAREKHLHQRNIGAGGLRSRLRAWGEGARGWGAWAGLLRMRPANPESVVPQALRTCRGAHRVPALR